MAATRYELTGYDGPLPIVLMVIPYRKDDRITYGSYLPSLEYIAYRGHSRGRPCSHSTIRGTCSGVDSQK